MKLLRKVSRLEVKRAFIIADQITQRKNYNNEKKFLKSTLESDFNKRLLRAKKETLRLKEKNLDNLVTPKWPQRVNSYNSYQWYLAEVDPKELGVWRRAGHLPLRWTNGSLAETAEKLKRGFDRKSKLIKGRPKHAIPNILKIKDHLEQKEKYLYPIVFKTDTGTRGRSRLKRKMTGDIDDGCMRSIALAMAGKNPIRIYFGTPPKIA